MKRLLSVCLLSLGLASAFHPAFAEAPVLRREGSEMVPPQPVAFKPGTAELVPASQVSLGLIADYLTNTSYISTLRIEGHVIGLKTEAANLALSKQRALTVLKWLVLNKIDCKRLIAVGFGSSKPVLTPPNPSNERIVFVNAALRGHSLGGLPLDGGGDLVVSGCE